jgi:hypothetical protein
VAGASDDDEGEKELFFSLFEKKRIFSIYNHLIPKVTITRDSH